MSQEALEIESIPLREVVEALRRTRPFAETDPQTFLDSLHDGLRVDRIKAKAGAVLMEPGDTNLPYCLVIEGSTRAERPEQDGSWTVVGTANAGDGFGETPLLTGRNKSAFRIIAEQDSMLLRFSAADFWTLLACCPKVREVVLANMATRLQAYQVEALHREKLVSLGTLAAGLMHELNNPGSAAKRAASQLRGNLMRLQELSLRSSSKPKTPPQLECMHDLLEHAVRGCHMPALSTMEQSEQEEALSEWLQAAGVENAFTIGPALVAIGFDRQELACAKDVFENGSFSDALNWLEALVSSVSLVCAIEESISRVTELVMAVKKFAYDDRSQARELDVHDSLQSTLTILGHKLRIKQIAVEKHFQAAPSTIRTRGSALSQVWTNLIDNAVDASPTEAQIEIATWTEPGMLAVSITDHGTGIPPETLPHIFEAFFTTKPQGSGTGLGLEIVHRIVTQKFGGAIEVQSAPGNTKFVVRLPMNTPTDSQNQKN
ncbi:MAG: ATP-binding protein [Terracidiphilus sp.]|jgi:signal transduction histidine kinase